MRLVLVGAAAAALFLLIGLWRWRAAPDAYAEADRLAAARAVTSHPTERDPVQPPMG